MPGKLGESKEKFGRSHLLKNFSSQHRDKFPLLAALIEWDEPTRALVLHQVTPGTELVIHGWTRQVKLLASSISVPPQTKQTSVNKSSIQGRVPQTRNFLVPQTYQGRFRVKLTDIPAQYSSADLFRLARGECVLVEQVNCSKDVTPLRPGDVVRVKCVKGYSSSQQVVCEIVDEGKKRDLVRVGVDCPVVFRALWGEGSSIKSSSTPQELGFTDSDVVVARDLLICLERGVRREVVVELIERGGQVEGGGPDLPLNTPILLRRMVTEPAVYASVQHPHSPSFHIPMRAPIYLRFLDQLPRASSPLLMRTNPKLSTLDRCVEELNRDVYMEICNKTNDNSMFDEQTNKLDVQNSDQSDNHNNSSSSFVSTEVKSNDHHSGEKTSKSMWSRFGQKMKRAWSMQSLTGRDKEDSGYASSTLPGKGSNREETSTRSNSYAVNSLSRNRIHGSLTNVQPLRQANKLEHRHSLYEHRRTFENTNLNETMNTTCDHRASTTDVTASATQNYTSTPRDSSIGTRDITANLSRDSSIGTRDVTANLSRDNSVGTRDVTAGLSRDNSIGTRDVTAGLSRDSSIGTRDVTAGLSRDNGIGARDVTANLSRDSSIGTRDVTAGLSRDNSIGTRDVTAGLSRDSSIGTRDVTAGLSRDSSIGTRDVTAGLSRDNSIGTRDVTAALSRDNSIGTRDVTAGLSRDSSIGTRDVTAGLSRDNGIGARDVSAGKARDSSIGTRDVTAGLSRDNSIGTRDVTANLSRDHSIGTRGLAGDQNTRTGEAEVVSDGIERNLTVAQAEHQKNVTNNKITDVNGNSENMLSLNQNLNKFSPKYSNNPKSYDQLLKEYSVLDKSISSAKTSSKYSGSDVTNHDNNREVRVDRNMIVVDNKIPSDNLQKEEIWLLRKQNTKDNSDLTKSTSVSNNAMCSLTRGYGRISPLPQARTAHVGSSAADHKGSKSYERRELPDLNRVNSLNGIRKTEELELLRRQSSKISSTRLEGENSYNNRIRNSSIENSNKTATYGIQPITSTNYQTNYQSRNIRASPVVTNNQSNVSGSSTRASPLVFQYPVQISQTRNKEQNKDSDYNSGRDRYSSQNRDSEYDELSSVRSSEAPARRVSERGRRETIESEKNALLLSLEPTKNRSPEGRGNSIVFPTSYNILSPSQRKSSYPPAQMSLPRDGNLRQFSCQQFLDFLDSIRVERDVVELCRAQRVDGRKFSQMTSEDLMRLGLDHPVVSYFHSRSFKP